MPNATFVANFDQFFSAVQKAEAQLRDFETGAGKVQSSLDRMANALSGTKMIQDATLMSAAVEQIGGTSKLTTNELASLGAKANEAVEKMRRLGIEIPEGLRNLAAETKNATTAVGGLSGFLNSATGLLGAFGIGLGVAQVVSFGREILTSADSLVRLHDRTGISIEGLQVLRVAGEDAGVSLESMADAANKLEKRLGSGDTAVIGAVNDLGIGIDAFRKMDADQRFVAISDAVKGMHDPLRVAADLSELFGRAWAEQLPVLKHGFDSARDHAVAMSSETVNALHEASDAAGRFWLSTKAVFGEALGDLLTGTTSKFRAVRSEVELFAQTAAKTAANFGALVPPSLPKDLESIEAQFVKDEEAIKKSWAATKQWTDAMIELDSAGVGWRGTLDTLDGATVDAVKFYLQAGVSQSALAAAYGATAVQIKAVASALEDEAEWTKFVNGLKEQTKRFDAEVMQSRNKAITEGLAQIKQAEAALRDFEMKAALSTTDYQIVKIWEAADAQEKAFRGTEQQYRQFAKTVEALATDQAQAVIDAADAEADRIAHLNDTMASLPMTTAAASMGLDSFHGTLALGITDLDDYNKAITKFYDQFVGIAGSVGQLTGTSQVGQPRAPSISGRASGGPVSAGQSYIVGEHRQPELFTPGANGFVTPLGASGTTVHNTFNVNGSIKDLARQLMDEITRTMKQSRLFPSA